MLIKNIPDDMKEKLIAMRDQIYNQKILQDELQCQ